MNERQFSSEWTESQLVELIQSVLTQFKNGELLDDFLLPIRSELDKLKQDSFRLRDDLDYLNDRFEDVDNYNTRKFDEIYEFENERAHNAVNEGINSCFNFSQLAIFFSMMKKMKVLSESDSIIAENVNGLTGVGKESFRKGLGMNKPNSSFKEDYPNEKHYENLNKVRGVLGEMIESLNVSMKEIQDSVPIEKRANI